MTTTIGTTQTTISFNATTLGYCYFGRWISDIIGQSSIAANTWTLTWGYADAALADAGIAIALYVWRPSTTTKIGTIFDSTIAFSGVSNTETGHKVTFSGSAIASGITTNDVLILEFMVNASSPVTKTFYYDGTTVITTNATSVSSAASYVETPENIALGAPIGINATSTSKVITTNIITKA